MSSAKHHNVPFSYSDWSKYKGLPPLARLKSIRFQPYMNPSPDESSTTVNPSALLLSQINSPLYTSSIPSIAQSTSSQQMSSSIAFCPPAQHKFPFPTPNPDSYIPTPQSIPMLASPKKLLSFVRSEQIKSMLSKELKQHENMDYLYTSKDKRLKNGLRYELLCWLKQVSDQLGLEGETFYIASRYFDRFLSLSRTKLRGKPQLFVLAVTSLYISAKMEEETNEPSIGLIAEAAKDLMDIKAIKRMEKNIFKTLSFEMWVLTPYAMASELLNCMPEIGSVSAEALFTTCQAFLSSCCYDPAFLSFSSVSLGLAAVVFSLEFHGLGKFQSIALLLVRGSSHIGMREAFGASSCASENHDDPFEVIQDMPFHPIQQQDPYACSPCDVLHSNSSGCYLSSRNTNSCTQSKSWVSSPNESKTWGGKQNPKMSIRNLSPVRPDLGMSIPFPSRPEFSQKSCAFGSSTFRKLDSSQRKRHLDLDDTLSSKCFILEKPRTSMDDPLCSPSSSRMETFVNNLSATEMDILSSLSALSTLPTYGKPTTEPALFPSRSHTSNSYQPISSSYTSQTSESQPSMVYSEGQCDTAELQESLDVGSVLLEKQILGRVYREVIRFYMFETSKRSFSASAPRRELPHSTIQIQRGSYSKEIRIESDCFSRCLTELKPRHLTVLKRLSMMYPAEDEILQP